MVAVWGTSAFLIVNLIRGRTFKSLFFYEFVFYLSAYNFILIGAIYSFMRRYNLLEEVLAKIFTTLLMIYVAETLKVKTHLHGSDCSICFSPMDSS